jgi:Ca-activated chloride channel homolog
MYLGLNHLKRALSGRWALPVLSDGDDNNTRYTESEMRRLVRESDARMQVQNFSGRDSLEREI